MKYINLINKPKTKRGLATLNQLLNAAIKVFYEKGYSNASINDITNEADVATGTFYVYFDSKETLYRFLLLQCSHMIRKNLHDAISGCKSRREAEEVGLREWLNFVRDNKYIYNIIWESMYIDKHLFREYYVNFCKSYVKGLDKAKERGEVSKDIDSETLAYIMMGASNFLGLNWGIFKDKPEELDKVVDSFMHMLNYGIFTDQPAYPKEHKTESISKIRVDFSDYSDEDDQIGADADGEEEMETDGKDISGEVFKPRDFFIE